MFEPTPPRCRSSATRSRGAAPILLGGLLLLTGACFDDPVDERLVVDLSVWSSVRFDLEIALRPPASNPSDTLYARRLRTLESELLGGLDPWHDRFARLDGRTEGQSWERADGWLRRFERWAVVEQPADALQRFFLDTPLLVDVSETEGRLGLWVSAGPANRATVVERRAVERGIGRFADNVEVYLEVVRAIWRHLELQPERAAVVLRALFADLLDEEAPELPAVEQELLDLYEAVEQAVLDIFELDEDRDPHTLQELSRRVFDPFPAALAVVPPEGARLLEIEGFQVDAEGRLVAPRTSLWDAYPALAGRWASPDPLLARMRHAERRPDDPFPLEAFAAEPRLTPGPTPRPEEIRAAVVEALTPPATLSAVWQSR